MVIPSQLYYHSYFGISI